MSSIPKSIPCPSCGAKISSSETVCDDCTPFFPASLLKACSVPGDYALGLQDGAVLRFDAASIQGHWVHLDRKGGSVGLGFRLTRGVDIRIESVLWCADAPDRS